jgi:metal-responsive CopG/Arc/MetJ family transcriptional regulator
VPRKQVAAPPSPEKVPAQVYIDADQWARFDIVARKQNRSRSAQIRELIRRDIEAHDRELEATA